jgi:hypothetical protein
MTFETPRISSSGAPFHTPEASTLPPSARPLVQPDTLASYTKAEQHGSWCETICNCICLSVTGVFNCFRSLLSICFPSVAPKSKKVDLGDVIKIPNEGERIDVEEFNKRLDLNGDECKAFLLKNCDVANGVFPKLTGPNGLFNSIRGVSACEKSAELMPLLAEHVIKGIHSGELSANILQVQNRGEKFEAYYASCLYVFVFHFVSKVLEKQEVDMSILSTLSQDTLFSNSFQKVVQDLGPFKPQQVQKLVRWAKTNDNNLYQQLLTKI